MKRKVVSGMMLALLFIGILMLSYPLTFGDGYNPVADIQDPNSQIYMDQLVYEFDSPPTEVGDKFNVDVIGYNISEIFAYQVVIDYNSTLLNCTNAWPNDGFPDPNWVFFGLPTWGPLWASYIDAPSVGRNAELVGDALKNAEDELNLTDPPREGLLARFEFEILSVPETYEELSCVLSISSSWAVGTFVQSVEEVGALQKRSPWLTDSDYNIKGVIVLYITWKNTTYEVPVFTDCLIENYGFNHSLSQIYFDAIYETAWSCNVSIPKTLLDGAFKVLLDDLVAPSILTWSETHTFIYFNSTQLSHSVKIIGEIATRILGDLNGDAAVNILDAIILAGNFGKKG